MQIRISFQNYKGYVKLCNWILPSIFMFFYVKDECKKCLEATILAPFSKP